jgi:tetratricopeptide (TPR) repeat protein
MLLLLMVLGAGCSSGSSALMKPNAIAQAQRASTPSASASQVVNAQLADSLQFHPGKARDYYIKGATLQMQERAAEAILEFQQALRYDNAPSIHFAIAQNFVKLGKQDLALEELRTVIAQDSLFMPAYRLLGDLYVQQFRVDEAITVYEFLNNHDRSLDAMNRFMLARLYEMRNVDKAIALYNEILSESTDEEGMILARLAELYSQKGNSAKVLEYLEKLQKTAPDNQAVLFTLMDTYVLQKKYDSAYELFTSAEMLISEADAINLAARYGNALLGVVDESSTARRFAEKLLDRLELRNRTTYITSWQIQLISGLLAGSLERTARSNSYFDQAIALADTIVEVPLQICAFQFSKRQFQTMIRTAERTVRKFPTNGQAYFLWGLGLSQMDSTRQAIDVLTEAVRVDTANLDAWNQLGILHSGLGNVRASDTAYEHALRIDSTNGLANNNYAYSLSERNLELGRAQAMVETALKTEPKNPSYLDTMGWILYRRGLHKQAMQYIQEAIDTGDASATLYEHLGDAHDKLGDHEKAREAWREALRREPNRSSTKERLSNGTANNK